MRLGGQVISDEFQTGSEEQRKLGAQLLLSEVLEYVIKGLGVTPEVNGVKIEEPDNLTYTVTDAQANKLEMLDGLADVAYTMYWNAEAFGIPLEEGFDLVCDNNLGKFVKLKDWQEGECEMDEANWDCGEGVSWPSEVKRVRAVAVDGSYYAVGTDQSGKVRKPSSYQSVDLTPLL